MNDLYGIEGEVELSCSLEEDGIIYLTMGGNVSMDTIDAFVAWADKVKAAMRTSHEKNPNRVITLIDVTRLEQVDLHSIEELKKLMVYNKQFATKTAVFGASYFNKIITEMAIKLTGRTNMKLFDTREEALTWLQES